MKAFATIGSKTWSTLRTMATAVWLSGWAASGLLAEDWPQWNGPQRDGVWRESGVRQDIPADGLPVLWRAPVASGYSGPAVAQNRVVITDFEIQAGDAANDPGKRATVSGNERVVCFDAQSGRQLWEVTDPTNYEISYPAGPRATPTMDGDLVFTLGAEGRVQAIELATGRVVWKKELKEAYQTPAPMWGFCAHPLVDGDRLICLAGGPGSAVVALDKRTGEEIWRALTVEDIGYSPPTMITTESGPQLIIWHSESIQGLEPATGKVIWTLPLKPDYGMSIMAPRQVGDLLFASGIGSVGALIRLKDGGKGAEIVWQGEKDSAIYAGNSTPVVHEGTIYGSDCQKGDFLAVDLQTGKRLWQTFALTTGGERRASHGTAFVFRNGEQFWIFTETGDLVLAQLTPEKHVELGRFHVLEPTAEAFGRSVVWSYPAFANRALFARNDKELVCVSLAAP